MTSSALSRYKLPAAILLAVGTLAAFAPLGWNDFIALDDGEYIRFNPHVIHGLSLDNTLWAFSTGHAGNWHPLAWLSHQLDVELFGLRPGWHHLTSLLLHVVNTLCLFLLLQRWTGALWRSFFVAGLFALHPLHVESVAWASERKDVLCAFFFLLTLGAYTRYAESRGRLAGAGSGPDAGGQRDRGPRFYYLLALAFFALALMSKPMAVTLPLVLCLLDWWPLGRVQRAGRPDAAGTNETNWPALFREKLPFLALAIGASVITLRVQADNHAISFNLPFSIRVANAAAACFAYLAKTFWPAHLGIPYPHPAICFAPPRAWPFWQIGLGIIVPAGMCVTAWMGRRRWPWLATGWLWFLGTLAPTMGFIQAGSQAYADRYTYIPLIGLFIVGAWGAGELLARAPRLFPTAVAAGLMVLVVCGVRTHQQAACWRNNRTVFEQALRAVPENPLALYQTGVELLKAGEPREGEKRFRSALALNAGYADAYAGLGQALAATGRPDLALEQFESALRLRPDLAPAREQYAALLWKQGRRQDALDQYAAALRSEPGNPRIHYALARLAMESGQLPAAARHLQAVVEVYPDYEDALARLGSVLADQGLLDEAQERLALLARLQPANPEARLNLANVLWRRGRMEAALNEYTAAVRLAPGSAAAHYQLGFALAAGGRQPEAAAALAEALRLKPDYPEALTEQGLLLAAMGRGADALVSFREAVRACPTNANLQVNLANALLGAGQTNEAAAAFATALRLEPGLADQMARAGKALLEQQQFDAALMRLEIALRLNPDQAAAMQSLAWVLATHPRAESRDARRAVQLAGRLSQSETAAAQASTWRTLAAAEAANGQWNAASQAAEKARQLARAGEDKAAEQAIERELDLYRQQKSFHF